MVNSIGVATWNIGVGIGSVSALRDPGSVENHGFPPGKLNAMFATALREIDADFVCFQEVHLRGNTYSQTREIANLAGFGYYSDLALDVAHRFKMEGLRLGVSVMSKHEIVDTKVHVLTNPNLESQQENGEVWHTHNKGLISVKSNLVGIGDVSVISVHLLPFHRFNLNVKDRRVVSAWREVDAELSLYGDNRALICGDFNQNSLLPLLPNLFCAHGFKDVRFDKPTHRDEFFDHIVVSADFDVLESKVFDMYMHSDHYPCFAEVRPLQVQ